MRKLIIYRTSFVLSSTNSTNMNTSVADTTMMPSCSRSNAESVTDTINEIHSKIKIENLTDSDIEIVENPLEHPSTVRGHDKIDEIEREDFDEENRLIKQCSEIIVGASKVSGLNLCSANSSLTSSSETISSLSNTVTDYSLPGCSKDDYCDSNTTIRNMIKSKPVSPSYVAMEDIEPRFNPKPPKPKPASPEPNQPLFKNDFMKTLLGTEPDMSSVQNFTTYRDEDYRSCDNDLPAQPAAGRSSSNASSIGSSSSESFKDTCTVPSTSNAEKLLGHRPGNTRKSPAYQYGDDDESDDEVIEDAWCTCLSSHEDDDEDDEITIAEEERFWRKRRHEAPPVAPSPQSSKRFCGDSGYAQTSVDNDWSANQPSCSSAIDEDGPPKLNQWLNRFSSWSKAEKLQAIDALISRCTPSHVRHMMAAIEPLFQRDFISLLPKELALTVLGYLQPKDLLRAAQTCRYWRFLADDNLLWKEQCRRIGIKTLKKVPRSLPRCASPWKAAYMRQYLIENNWLHNPVENPIVMRGHDDHVITCLQFSGNRILSGSDDTTLKVWSAVTGKCLRTLVGHSGGVWSSQMVGDLVISGSTDRTLRVWSATTGQCLKVLTGHTSTVRCMHLHQDKVVSGSRDATLRVWSIPNGECLRVLVGHLAAVRCVQYDGKVVVSGAYDYFVKVWNPNTGECLHTLAGHSNRVYSLQFDGVHVVSGSLDTSIRVWDVETGQLKHTLTGHQSLTSGMELHSNILVSGNADSTVKVWDITTGHCLHTLSGPNKHQSAVTCLQSSNRFVITSSDDGTVKLWDVRTGEFIRNLVELGSGGSGGVVWRIRASATKLICAVGSRNGTEETKLLVLDFDVPGACRKCDE